jgi:hypothetical protein
MEPHKQNQDPVNQPFHYDPLETSTTTRILILYHGIEDEPLRGHLEHQELDAANGRYVALSYVWGEPKSERLLICGRRKLYLTYNLEQALKRIRLPTGELKVWVDAVCINQENIRERSHQVRIMGRIYQSAAEVMIWLGHDTTGRASTAFELLRARDLQPLAATETTEQIASILELSRCDYFKRVWVIQEAMLAPAGTVFWGQEQINIDSLSRSVSRLAYIFDAIPGAGQAFTWLSVLTHKIQGLDFFQVLQWARPRSCQDKHDRVYAILGLDYRSDLPWNQVVWSIHVDYNLPYEDLYLQVALETMKLGGTLRMLNSVHHGPSLESWGLGRRPSWMPTWSADAASDLYIGLWGEHTGCIGLTFLESTDLKNKTLLMRCRRVGQIAGCSLPNLLLDNHRLDVDKIYDFWATYVKPVARRCSQVEGARLMLRFWDAFYANVSSRNVEQSRIRDIFDILMLQRDEGALLAPQQTALDEMMNRYRDCVRTMEEGDISLAMDHRYIGPAWNLKGNLRGRKLFVTETDAFGLGPEAMQVGDIVVELEIKSDTSRNSCKRIQSQQYDNGDELKLDSTNLPFILRSQGSFYQLVGAAFIPVEVRRAAFKQAQETNPEMEELEIR